MLPLSVNAPLFSMAPPELKAWLFERVLLLRVKVPLATLKTPPPSYAELPEIVHVCDRAYVMREGTVAGHLNRDQLSEENLLALGMHDA